MMKRNFLPRLFCAGVLFAFALTCPSNFAADSTQRIEITAKQFQFMPNEITVKKGEPVELVIKSADVAHGLRVNGLDINVKVAAGGTAVARFTANRTGDFSGHCSTFCGAGHGSMKFKVHVVD
jgi:cytochrome c oxidase subunit II